MHWKQKYWFPEGKCIFLGNRGGSAGGLGTQNISFPSRKCLFLIALLGANKRALMHWKQKYWISLGNVYFLDTEEGLLVAWGRKILVLHKENIDFWQRKWWRSKTSCSWDHWRCASALEAKILIFLLRKLYIFWKQRRVCWWPGDAKY